MRVRPTGRDDLPWLADARPRVLRRPACTTTWSRPSPASTAFGRSCSRTPTSLPRDRASWSPRTRGGERLGFADLKPLDDRTGFLSYVASAEAARGRGVAGAARCAATSTATPTSTPCSWTSSTTTRRLVRSTTGSGFGVGSTAPWWVRRLAASPRPVSERRPVGDLHAALARLGHLRLRRAGRSTSGDRPVALRRARRRRCCAASTRRPSSTHARRPSVRDVVPAPVTTVLPSCAGATTRRPARSPYSRVRSLRMSVRRVPNPTGGPMSPDDPQDRHRRRPSSAPQPLLRRRAGGHARPARAGPDVARREPHHPAAGLHRLVGPTRAAACSTRSPSSASTPGFYDLDPGPRRRPGLARGRLAEGAVRRRRGHPLLRPHRARARPDPRAHRPARGPAARGPRARLVHPALWAAPPVAPARCSLYSLHKMLPMPDARGGMLTYRDPDRITGQQRDGARARPPPPRRTTRWASRAGAGDELPSPSPTCWPRSPGTRQRLRADVARPRRRRRRRRRCRCGSSAAGPRPRLRRDERRGLRHGQPLPHAHRAAARPRVDEPPVAAHHQLPGAPGRRAGRLPDARRQLPSARSARARSA